VYPQILAAALAAAQTTEAPAPLDPGWVVGEALANHPAVQAAASRAASARARPGLYTGIDDPSVSLGAEMLPAWVIGEPRQLTLGVSQRIALYPEREHLHAVEVEGAKAAEANARAVQLDVRLRALVAYHTLAEAIGSLRARERAAAVLRDLVDVAHRAYETGQTTQVDSLLAHRESERAQNDVEVARLEVAKARARVNEIIGREAGADLPDPPEPPGETRKVDAAVLEARALEARPEIAASERAVAQAEAAVVTRRDRYWPDLMAQAGGMIERDAAGMRDFGWMAMVGVRVPMWLERRAAGVDEAEGAAAAARSDAKSLKLAVRREVQEAALALEQARIQVELYRDRLVPLAKDALKAAIAAYNTGRTSFITVLDAQRQLVELDVAEVAARAGYNRRLAALDRAVGVLP
jgi:cobalt-zinc-cadmium efflux system outer membrane protein